MKACSRCKLEKPGAEFWVERRRGRLSSRCKSCGTEVAREWRSKNPGYEKARYQRDKAGTRERHLRRKYGVDLAAYEAMFVAQGGACAICSRKQERAFDVDHCHATGRVRGLLCTNCNRMIGHASDDPARLRMAADYLAIVPQAAAEFVRALL